MAGKSRSVEFDLLVTGTETGGRKVAKLGDAFDDLRDKVERLDGKTAHVKGIAKLEKDSDSLSDSAKAMASKVLTSAAAVVKFASVAGLAAGAAGPLAIGIGAATDAAGAIFLKLTFKGMGEEFEKSVEPITKGWDKQTSAAGKLATRGLKPLSKEFAKINLPVIAEAQNRIARSTDRVITGFGKWVNSAAGTKVIQQITSDTADTFDRLAPSVRGVVQSFIMMAGRVSGVAFKETGDGAQYLLDKLNGFLDRIDGSDVTRGFDRIRDAAQAVATGFRAITDAVKWVDANRQKIMQLSDSILVLTGVGAALTGGWVVALGVGLLLLARHWDDVTAAVQKTVAYFSGLKGQFTSTQGTIESLRGGWERLKSGFQSFVDQVGPKVVGYIDALKVAFIRAQPVISIVVDVLGRWYEILFKVAGFLVGQMYAALTRTVTVLGLVAQAAGIMAAKFLDAFADIVSPIASVAKKLHLPFAKELAGVAADARNASQKLNRSMDQVKTDTARAEVERLQRKVNSLKGKTVKTEADKNAIAAAQARIASLQRSINNVHGKTVYVNIKATTFRSVVDIGHDRDEHRAAGGPVVAGRQYIVGERRPEVFIPSQSGRIVPRVPSGFGGGGGTTIVNVNLPHYVGSRDDLIREIRAAVKTKGGGNVQVALGRAR